MKKIFTLLTSSLFTLSLLAFDGSKLSITSVNLQKELKVEVDGRRFIMQDNAITISNLSEGYHDVKIFSEKRKDRNSDIRSFDFNRGSRAELIYSNSIYLKRGIHLDITVNRFGKVLTDERRMDRTDDFDDEDGYYNNGNTGWNGGRDNAVNSREFETLKFSLKKEWFENSRLTIAQMAIDKNRFTTQQVKELMQLFAFENNRLEIAKSAYRKTVDKENYYQLNDALFFSSKKQELADYIRTCRF